jgi:hypothetical protein
MLETFFVSLLLLTSTMLEVQSGAATYHRQTRSVDDIAKIAKLDSDLKKMSNLKDLPAMQRRSDKPYVASVDSSAASGLADQQYGRSAVGSVPAYQVPVVQSSYSTASPSYPSVPIVSPSHPPVPVVIVSPSYTPAPGVTPTASASYSSPVSVVTPSYPASSVVTYSYSSYKPPSGTVPPSYSSPVTPTTAYGPAGNTTEYRGGCSHPRDVKCKKNPEQHHTESGTVSVVK